MSSSKMTLELELPSVGDIASTRPPGTFLGNVLNSYTDRLYDLPEDIPDVMGLQALRPSALVCKVMTVPSSRCVRVVTPDERLRVVTFSSDASDEYESRHNYKVMILCDSDDSHSLEGSVRSSMNDESPLRPGGCD